jgi:hypothetical protein
MAAPPGQEERRVTVAFLVPGLVVVLSAWVEQFTQSVELHAAYKVDRRL